MKTGITTHVLDLGEGRPAAGLSVTLWRQGSEGREGSEGWEPLGEAQTDGDGRVARWSGIPLIAGTYRLSFATAAWFAAQSRETFYPSVDIVFQVDEAAGHYHVPLLLNRWGYSTYRGS